MEKDYDETKLWGSVKVLTQKQEVIAGDRDPFMQKIEKDNIPDAIVKMHNIQNRYVMEKAKGGNSNPGSKDLTTYVGKTVYNVLDVASPKYNLDYLSQLYDVSSFHAAAIDAKIDNTVGLGYSFEYSRTAEKLREKATKKSDLAKRKTEVQLEDTREALDKFVENLNVEDEIEQTLQKFLKDRFTMGNGYLEIGRNSEGVISYLGHLPAKTIRIRNRRDGFVQWVDGRAIFFRNFGDRKTPDPVNGDPQPNEIIHYRIYSPTDNFYGVPEVVAVSHAIAGMEFAQRYNIDYFENKTVPRYIIKTKGFYMDPQQQADMMKFFETTMKGTSHRTVLIPMPGGADKDVEFQPVESDKQDSSFDSYMKLNIQYILARHRVPQARIGLSSAASSSAESKESDRTFKEAVCRPEQRIIEKKLNKAFGELTDLFNFKLKEYALTDEDQKSQIYERFLRWGVLVPDEVRTELGRQPRSDDKGSEPVDQRTLTEMGANIAAQQAAENKAQAFQNRTRDQNRNSSASDKPQSAQSRNPKGDGRKAGT